MSHGRFDNPVVATMTGILDLFRKQKLSERLSEQDRIMHWQWIWRNEAAT
jgi:hypothetical protein